MNCKTTTALLGVLVIFLMMLCGFLMYMGMEITDNTRACYHDSPWTVESRSYVEDEDVWSFDLQCETDGRIYTKYKAERPTWARIGDTMHFNPIFHNNISQHEDKFKNR